MSADANLHVQPGFDGYWVVLHGSNGRGYNLSDRAAERETGAHSIRRDLERELREIGPEAWCSAHDLPLDAQPGSMEPNQR